MKLKITLSSKQVPEPLPNIGGRDQAGNVYGANSHYLTKNGRPILPIMGEFHFSRYEPAEWEEAVLKMRAGGIGIVATYVFWNHHEECKGVWDFTGRRDIRAFLEICRKLQMPVWLRIGPWAHGECRNGGFPDWLVAELGHNGLHRTGEAGGEHEARANDPLYLRYVREYWSRLAQEVQGEMCADGGPVIGIQLENEYCHAGGPADKTRGAEHMRTLYALAQELGFYVPYYTTTAWGGAIVLDGLTLPVLGGYVDAPWAGHTDEMPANENFLFTPFRQDENIGADLAIDVGAPGGFDQEGNPYLTAELGGGLQATALRRPYPYAEDTQAQALCMLGAGVNLLGYYMYHGGTNPDGLDAALQESRETGYFNDLPAKSYDFAAPIRESGRLHDSYHKLKMLHLFVHAFEESLAQAAAVFPDIRPTGAEDLTTPRVSVRYNHDTGEGFVFINNHQRLREMQPIRGLAIEADGRLICHDVGCETDHCGVIPFGLRMGESKLLSTNAFLLTRLGGRYFFYWDSADGAEPYFTFDGEPYKNIIVLTGEEAEHAYVFGDKLYITARPMLERDGHICVLTGEEPERIVVYGETGEPRTMAVQPQGVRAQAEVTAVDTGADCPPEEAIQTRLEQEPSGGTCRVYELTLRYKNLNAESLHDIFLQMDFGGNRAQLYQDGQLLTDWFSNGEIWQVALARYGYPERLTLVIYPFEEQVYYNLPPRKGCELRAAGTETEYWVTL